MKRILLTVLSVAILPLAGRTADDFSKVRKNQSAQEIPLMMEAGPASADFQCSEILGFPTDTSVQIHLVPRHDMDLTVRYGTQEESLDRQTVPQPLRGGTPHIVRLENLKPDAEYFYRLEWGGTNGAVHRFHTARPPGATFSFAVQADPHLDENSSPVVYSNTLCNIAQARPDFLIDLGDASMVDKLPQKTDEAFTLRNLLMRNWYAQVAHSVPLFMVHGNHDGELGWLFDGTAGSPAVRATNIRKQFYPIALDNFYNSAAPDEKFCGTVRSYTSWTWGDALFVVIDPYRYTPQKPGKKTDGWSFTLGETQYRWLRATLENSTAKYKFVFGHQLVGGEDQGRGGIERADWFEWGGRDTDGKYRFDEKRPGWGKPIHQLFVDTGVTVYFHGHDHFYARQEKDGVIYQLVPQPAHENMRIPGYAADYGYTTGELLGGPGFVKVTVSPDGAVTEFVRSESPRKGGKQ